MCVLPCRMPPCAPGLFPRDWNPSMVPARQRSVSSSQAKRRAGSSASGTRGLRWNEPYRVTPGNNTLRVNEPHGLVGRSSALPADELSSLVGDGDALLWH